MKKILIVDDSAFMREYLRELIETKNPDSAISRPVQIFEAHNKYSALKKIELINPDMIMLDIIMQESETAGIELLYEIQNRYDMKKVVMISSLKLEYFVEKC